jgi:flagellar motor switch protein FliG
MHTTTNLRKAAILIRSMDGETAAKLLGQLSSAEAKALRLAMQSLGSIAADERNDVLIDFRQGTPLSRTASDGGVEIAFSNEVAVAASAALPEARPATKPFEFLEQARIESLVPYLAREQSQTIAVVLSYLPPARAADVLAALPARLQAESIERLSLLGETDPNSLHVLERELAAWLARQQSTRVRGARRTDAVSAILAAADKATRGGLVTNLAQYNRQLAEDVSSATAAPRPSAVAAGEKVRAATVRVAPINEPAALQRSEEFAFDVTIHSGRGYQPDHESRRPRPSIKFHDIARLDQTMLAAVLRSVDAELLVLALAGADEELIERIAGQMPRATGKVFRQRLRQFGPTRLRDVTTAQEEVAEVASRIIQGRRRTATTLVA